jgi:MerR family transcriptional regulator/heat shock protein HspR
MAKLALSSYEPIFSIGRAAERLGTAASTLRMYEQRGLVIPAKSPSGRRTYSVHDLELLLCVREMIADEGLNIQGIRRLMALIPCWKWKKCTAGERRDCRAYTEASAPCWTLEDAPCRQNGDDCRDCRVYRDLSDCRSLKKLLGR